MRFLIVTLFGIFTLTSALVILDHTLDKEWIDFKELHKKIYTTKNEENLRRMIFEKNLKKIDKHNVETDNGLHTFRLKMNKFGDMTNEEFRAVMNGFNMSMIKEDRPKVYFQPSINDIPDTVDWRTQGYVTPVKDQEQCGSCWAFSAVAALEGQHFKASGQLVSLSEQNLVDCSQNTGNMGCDGGLMDQAFTYIRLNKGIDTEKSYPYYGYDRKCKFNPANVGATDNGFIDIQSGSEADLTYAIATIGPISVAIDASQDSFQFYETGIYYEPACSSTDLDHGVTAVGYGGTRGSEFYIVKNSWGSDWGDDGYIKMSRFQKNNCGIATAASYPIV